MYVRVPQSISGNWVAGIKSEAVVESLDLYATLADLAGLPPPAQPLGGESLRPLLTAAPGPPRNKTWALSQWPRRPSCVTHHSCTDGHGNPYEFLPDQAIMGYKLRVADWAYTAWFGFDWGQGADPTGAATVPLWDQVFARELYDHRGDDGTMESGETYEWDNVVNDGANVQLVSQLHAQLVEAVKTGLEKW
mmetsp:Transcript_3734/g.11719  ORF Transcript_3734/g.11719 Transcript_3734/m.11719 type:complete len:192 (-) Transcript_3734:147-722(-)